MTKELLINILESRDLSKAGELFNVSDWDIVSNLHIILARTNDVFASPDFLTNYNSQTVVEICMGRITSAVRETGTIETYAPSYIDILEACLGFPLVLPSHSQKGGGAEMDELAPHAKISSDLLAALFQQYRTKSVMTVAIPVAVKFLNCPNLELVRAVSSYLSLAAIHNARLLAQYAPIIIKSVIDGNGSLVRVLPQIYPDSREPFHASVSQLTTVLASYSDCAVKLSLLQLFVLVTKSKPQLIIPYLNKMKACLYAQSTCAAALTIYMLLVSAEHTHVLADQMGALRKAGEMQSRGQNLTSICQIMAAIGCSDKLLSQEAMSNLVYLCHKVEPGILGEIFREIEKITLKFPMVVENFLPDLAKICEQNGSTALKAAYAKIYEICSRSTSSKSKGSLCSSSADKVTIIAINGESMVSQKSHPEMHSGASGSIGAGSPNLLRLGGSGCGTPGSSRNSASAIYVHGMNVNQSPAVFDSRSGPHFPSNTSEASVGSIHIIGEKHVYLGPDGRARLISNNKRPNLSRPKSKSVGNLSGGNSSARRCCNEDRGRFHQKIGVTPNGGVPTHNQHGGVTEAKSRTKDWLNPPPAVPGVNVSGSATPLLYNGHQTNRGGEFSQYIPVLPPTPSVTPLSSLTTTPVTRRLANVRDQAATRRQARNTAFGYPIGSVSPHPTSDRTHYSAAIHAIRNDLESARLQGDETPPTERFPLSVPTSRGRLETTLYRDHAITIRQGAGSDLSCNALNQSNSSHHLSSEMDSPSLSERQQHLSQLIQLDPNGLGKGSSTPGRGRPTMLRISAGSSSMSSHNDSILTGGGISENAPLMISVGTQSTATLQSKSSLMNRNSAIGNGPLMSFQSHQLDQQPVRVNDVVKHFCEKHLGKIKLYMSDLGNKYPIPCQCTVEELKHKKHMRVHFMCQEGSEHCLHKTNFFAFKTKIPGLWIHLMFLHLQAQMNTALYQAHSAVLKLKVCWECLPVTLNRNNSFSTLVTSAFPNFKDQQMILAELHFARYFDLFAFNGVSKKWACFACNHPERVANFLTNQFDIPVIEGQLKEKRGRWKFFKRWRTRYFTLSGAALSYKGVYSERDVSPAIDIKNIRSVKSVTNRRSRRTIPKAFEIFTEDDCSYMLKAKDRQHAEEWFQFLQIAVAQVQKEKQTTNV